MMEERPERGLDPGASKHRGQHAGKSVEREAWASSDAAALRRGFAEELPTRSRRILARKRAS
jgi:hypothetical protein